MRITTFDHFGFPKSVAFEMESFGRKRISSMAPGTRFFAFLLVVILFCKSIHTSSKRLKQTQHLLYALTNKLTFRGVEQKMKQSAVMSARIAFSVLGFLMLGTLIYTLLTDGSPFRKELLTPWMVATLIDFYINVVALSVGLGCLQGIEFDQWILMDIVIDMLWEHYYLRLRCQTAGAAYFSRSSLPNLI
ncbi:hypothetical protein POTOM_019754 [Populus tomentosa]|uniref:Uncharacterized protein n=1 Tax=Populus tomentosa TaxID=118781 RepID=A0A8X7ZSH2_POPTO|nr:hypothetical protein POTOM_019754 [Populus tomentosa]